MMKFGFPKAYLDSHMEREVHREANISEIHSIKYQEGNHGNPFFKFQKNFTLMSYSRGEKKVDSKGLLPYITK